MSALRVNTEHLIALVEERPVIWDKTCEEYKYRNLKTAAWDEICSILINDFKFLPVEEKNEAGKALIKTWNTEREKWMKWRSRVKKSQKSGAGASTIKNVAFSEQLLFLDKIVTQSENRTDSLWQENPAEQRKFTSGQDPAEQQISTSVRIPSQVSQCSNQTQKYNRPTKKRQVDQFEREIIEALKATPASSPASSEREPHILSFFRGILPALDEFGNEEMFEFQLRVLSLIKEIKQKTKDSQQHHAGTRYTYSYHQSHPTTSSASTQQQVNLLGPATSHRVLQQIENIVHTDDRMSETSPFYYSSDDTFRDCDIDFGILD